MRARGTGVDDAELVDEVLLGGWYPPYGGASDDVTGSVDVCELDALLDFDDEVFETLEEDEEEDEEVIKEDEEMIEEDEEAVCIAELLEIRYPIKLMDIAVEVEWIAELLLLWRKVLEEVDRLDDTAKDEDP